MEKEEFPFQNRSLKNKKGEIWKAVPGLQGYFVVSNFGRIKRLPYELIFEDGRIYQMKPMIMKPSLVKSPNHFINDNTFFLRITLTVSKHIYNFSIGRMVYFVFKGVFDWHDENLMVVCQDGDGRNIRPENLLLLNRSERQLKVINDQRHENILLRPEVRTASIVANRQKLGRQLSQYDGTGYKIATYAAIPQAAELTGISRSNISNVLWKRKVTAGGYYWRYGAREKIDIVTFLKKRKAAYKNSLDKQVTQFTTQGKKIATYPSINEASRRTGVCSTAIGKMVNGKALSAGGYFWQKGQGTSQIILNDYLHGTGAKTASKRKKVKQYHLSGKYLRTYTSLREAAASLGLAPGGLTATCKGYQKTFGGFRWKYCRS